MYVSPSRLSGHVCMYVPNQGGSPARIYNSLGSAACLLCAVCDNTMALGNHRDFAMHVPGLHDLGTVQRWFPGESEHAANLK